MEQLRASVTIDDERIYFSFIVITSALGKVPKEAKSPHGFFLL
jgi:hypothetical protein